MYFTINTAFANYLEMFPSLIDPLQIPLITNRTMYEQTLPVNLSVPNFDKSLLHVFTNLKDFINSYTKRKEIFDSQERHETILKLTKISFQIITLWTFSCSFPQ